MLVSIRIIHRKRVLCNRPACFCFAPRIWYNEGNTKQQRDGDNLAEKMRINRSNDYLFKRIFGSDEGKDVLLSFLNAVLKSPPGGELKTVNLVDRELDPKYLFDRSAR